MVARDRGYMVRGGVYPRSEKKNLPANGSFRDCSASKAEELLAGGLTELFPFHFNIFFLLLLLLSLCYKYICVRRGYDGIFSPFSGVRRETDPRTLENGMPPTHKRKYLDTLGGNKKKKPPKNRK
jgi:hypothetical protein